MRPSSQRWMPRAWVLPCLVALALLAGPLPEVDRASPADRGKVVLRFSHNQPTIRIPHQAAVLFKQLVEERTQGYYDVQLFPAQQLGSLRDQVEQTMLGTIEVTQQPAAILSLFVPKVMLMCPQCHRPTRVGYDYTDGEGKLSSRKYRKCKHPDCGKRID